MNLPFKSVTIFVFCLLISACNDSNSAPQSATQTVREDPLLRMPGTQPGEAGEPIESSTTCYKCHGGAANSWVKKTPDQRNRTNYDEYNIYGAWQGSMMGNSARDPLMFACFTVSAQDSIFATGTPNAVDLCLRCHFPKGWLEGRSSTLNASAMTGEDYDGIQCSFCHRLVDPFYTSTFVGEREGANWTLTWDEQNSSLVSLQFRSQFRALQTYLADSLISPSFKKFDGSPFHVNDAPFSHEYTEAAGGQYFVSPTNERRGPFADVDPALYPNLNPALHKTMYSRFHKGKFFCATCHDVSNPVIANLPQKNVKPGDKVALTSESQSAFMWSHVERTYSEFRLSAYNNEGGAPGKGNFAPNTPKKQFPVNGWETDQPDNNISKCQDCHMCSRYSPGTNLPESPVRPEGSSEHPDTWTPCHAMTGANVWMTTILFSIAPNSPNPDAENRRLLLNPKELTMDVMQGTWTTMNPKVTPPPSSTPLTDTMIADALKLAADRIGGTTTTKGVLQNAANIKNIAEVKGAVDYDPVSGGLKFRVHNNTGHKLISGFPEGRRMFVNVKFYNGTGLIYEINPYSDASDTLKGLPWEDSASSPPITDPSKEIHMDELVYEAKLGSTLTKEKKTFHFALATHRYKDNRIPPKGFRIADAATRLSEPVWHGVSSPDYFTAAEYGSGYDEVDLSNLKDPFAQALYNAYRPKNATNVVVTLYYQTTSREYVEFLRDEINGNGRLTLPANAYVIQTHPFFTRLKAWGNTMYDLWFHNRKMPGGAPFEMTKGTWTAP